MTRDKNAESSSRGVMRFGGPCLSNVKIAESQVHLGLLLATSRLASLSLDMLGIEAVPGILRVSYSRS